MGTKKKSHKKNKESSNRWSGPHLQSFVVNIMDSVWDYVKRPKKLRRPKSTKELWQVLHVGLTYLPNSKENYAKLYLK